MGIQCVLDKLLKYWIIFFKEIEFLQCCNLKAKIQPFEKLLHRINAVYYIPLVGTLYRRLPYSISRFR